MIVTKKQLEVFKKEFEELEETVNALEENVGDIKVSELDTEQAALAARVVVLESYLKDYLEYLKRKQADEPFIEVLSQSFDERNGMQLKLDWNPAMINYLKRHGYQGVDDDGIIQKYIADLFNQAREEGHESLV